MNESFFCENHERINHLNPKIEKCHRQCDRCKRLIKGERIYHEAFDRYIRPSRYEEMDRNGWIAVRFPFGGGVKQETLNMIDEYLRKGVRVRGGYMTTSIRGYHDKYIFVKHKHRKS